MTSPAPKLDGPTLRWVAETLDNEHRTLAALARKQADKGWYGQADHLNSMAEALVHWANSFAARAERRRKEGKTNA